MHVESLQDYNIALKLITCVCREPGDSPATDCVNIFTLCFGVAIILKIMLA